MLIWVFFNYEKMQKYFKKYPNFFCVFRFFWVMGNEILRVWLSVSYSGYLMNNVCYEKKRKKVNNMCEDRKSFSVSSMCVKPI